jgi:hypothetical protein
MATKILIVTEHTVVDNMDDVADLILAKNQLAIIDAGYQDLGIETPDWILDQLVAIDSQITAQVRGQLQARLRAAKARRSNLATMSEKRASADAEIKELEDKLK